MSAGRLGAVFCIVQRGDVLLMSVPKWFWSFVAGFVIVGSIVGVSEFVRSGDGSAAPSEPATTVAPSESSARDAPDFSLETLDGSTFTLSEHEGEVVVLNFWATWCPPCREEIPMFVKLQRQLGDEGLQFVGVALERSAGPKEVRAFTERMNVNYPVGLGQGRIAKKYGGIRGLPTTFVIGPKGKIRGQIPGRATESMLRPGLERLLEETS